MWCVCVVLWLAEELKWILTQVLCLLKVRAIPQKHVFVRRTKGLKPHGRTIIVLAERHHHPKHIGKYRQIYITPNGVTFQILSASLYQLSTTINHQININIYSFVASITIEETSTSNSEYSTRRKTSHTIQCIDGVPKPLRLPSREALKSIPQIGTPLFFCACYKPIMKTVLTRFYCV